MGTNSESARVFKRKEKTKINMAARRLSQVTKYRNPTCDWMIKIVKINKLYLNSLIVSIVNRVS